MFNLTEFEYYRQFAIDAFNRLNGLVNKVCNVATLEIFGDCFIEQSYGEIVFPNRIRIFLNAILRDYPTDISKRGMIVYTIIHELSHVDQFFSLVAYSNYDAYHDMIEDMADNNTNYFIDTHKELLDKEFNLEINVPKSYKDRGNRYKYVRVDLYNFYLQTLVNVVHRNITQEAYEYISDILNNNDTILISFNNNGDCCIKADGVFIQEDLLKFTNDIVKYCSPNIVYDVISNVVCKENMCIISYEIINIDIQPILYCDK